MVIWRFGNAQLAWRLYSLVKGKALKSQPFILSNGFAFRLIIFLNGTEKLTGQYVSLYIQMLQSQTRNDPFNGVVTCVAFTNDGVFTSKSFRALSTSPSWGIPIPTCGNAPAGLEKFINLEAFRNGVKLESVGVCLRYYSPSEFQSVIQMAQPQQPRNFRITSQEDLELSEYKYVKDIHASFNRMVRVGVKSYGTPGALAMDGISDQSIYVSQTLFKRCWGERE